MRFDALLLALGASIGIATLTSAAMQQPPYDLVIANGQVMDPESGLDAVRYLGIRGGSPKRRIA
jgi:hypothetical protein